jgi:hypothetical protein
MAADVCSEESTFGGYQYLRFFSDPRYWLGLQRKKWGASDTALIHISTDLSSPIGQFRLVARAVTGEMAVI